MLKGETTRLAFSIIAGVLLQFYMYRVGCAYFYVMSGVAYALLRSLQRNPWMPLVVWVWSIGFLSGVHIYRMATDYGGWHMDQTAYLMPLVLKVASVGFVVRDGQSDTKVLTDR